MSRDQSQEQGQRGKAEAYGREPPVKRQGGPAGPDRQDAAKDFVFTGIRGAGAHLARGIHQLRNARTSDAEDRDGVLSRAQGSDAGVQAMLMFAPLALLQAVDQAGHIRPVHVHPATSSNQAASGERANRCRARESRDGRAGRFSAWFGCFGRVSEGCFIPPVAEWVTAW